MDTLDILENLVGSEYSISNESPAIFDDCCDNQVAVNNKIVDIVLAEI